MDSFAWIDFYSEFATTLLHFANDRKPLIEMVKAIYSNTNLKPPTLGNERNIVDIDPFTVFGLFNKGISTTNRIAILNRIKELFDISASVPTDFDGIPVLNNTNAAFYSFNSKHKEKDIENLWSLFQYAIAYADRLENKEEFITAFDTVIAQKGVSWNITMGLYWIRPMTFINLDARNRKHLENNQARFLPSIDTLKILRKMLSAENYLLLIEKVKNTMVEYKSFPELSFDAWKKSNAYGDVFYGENSSYWPTLAEYDPRLSKNDWKKYMCLST